VRNLRVVSPGAAGFAEANGRRTTSGEADTRPVIRIVEGELPSVVDEAEQVLLDSDEQLFQRGGALVRVVRRDVPSARDHKKVHRPSGSLSIVLCDRTYLVETLTRVARWERWDKRSEAWRAVDAPERIAATYLARGAWRLRPLRATISAPTLRLDGSVLQTPGYDEATATWYDPCGVAYNLVPESPTRAHAEAALEELLWAFRTFPFDGEADRSVALALALTGLLRRNLPAAPLGAISAPLRGSGKTLLADCIAILATGVSAPAMLCPADGEEAAKLLLAVLAEGDAVVLIDNVERTLQGDWLCTVLTSETFRARMLGRTEMMSVPTSTLWLATGNHLTIAGDLSTRTLYCYIDPHLEKPEEREFVGDLRVWFSQNRARLVVAGLTVMRACALASPAELPPLRPFGRFEIWSDLVRRSLVWLGLEDPCASVRAIEREDPQRLELLQLMEAWRVVFGSEPKTAREVLAATTDPACRSEGMTALRDAIESVAGGHAGEPNLRRLGKWLSKNAGRICGGRHFTKYGERCHVALWRLTEG